MRWGIMHSSQYYTKIHVTQGDMDFGITSRAAFSSC